MTWLVPVVLALTLAAAAAGLLVPDVYATDGASTAMFRGWDLVTLAVAPGCLLAAFVYMRRRRVLGEVGAASLLAYLAYTYAYYVFGTGFNDLFLLHIAVFAASVLGLLLALLQVDVDAVAARFPRDGRVRWVAGILGALTVGLAGMWVYALIDNAATGGVPVGSSLVESDAITHLGIALDLSVLVPLYAAAAVLLWRRRPWGFLLGAIALVAGVLHQVSYIVAMPFQVAAGVPGAVSSDPAEPVIIALYLLGAALLLAPVFRGGPQRVRARRR